jgi:mono/diheme cytochrome c family protein
MEGPSGYAYVCSACHGKEGEGKGYLEYKTGIPAIGKVDFRRVASEDFIRFTLEKGRSLRQMGSWASSVSGMQRSELDRIASYLKNGRGPVSGRVTPGNPSRGHQLFDQQCQVCHGENGHGGVAVALNQPGFLERADDTFIFNTLVNGRGNTAMPAWAHLEQQAISDLVSFLRSWGGSGSPSRVMQLPEANLDQGGLQYHFLCSRCHGDFGEGETGPAIINRDFLEAAEERFLYETIAEGRAHTAMFGWSSDVYNKEKLGIQDISNIIGFMKQAAMDTLTYIFQGSNPGNRDAGEGIYAERCAECHGKSGEGMAAPALNNQEFLGAASNGFLLATITLGRKGTAMPAWGYGEEGFPALSGKERQDLVAMVRSWPRIHIKF